MRMSGAIGIITGFGRLVVIGGERGGEVIEREIAPGLFKYPNGDPRKDPDWDELYGPNRVFKDDFTQADKALGFHTHHGGAAFIALARYLAWPLGRDRSQDIRVTLSHENYARHDAVYALGMQAVFDTLVGIENGELRVSGLMSENRQNLLRAVIAGEVSDEIVEFDEEGTVYELEASGFTVDSKQLDPGQRIEYRALNPTRLVIVAGGAVVQFGRSSMALYGVGDECELDQWDTAQLVATERGVQYLQAVQNI